MTPERGDWNLGVTGSRRDFFTKDYITLEKSRLKRLSLLFTLSLSILVLREKNPSGLGD